MRKLPSKLPSYQYDVSIKYDNCYKHLNPQSQSKNSDRNSIVSPSCSDDSSSTRDVLEAWLAGLEACNRSQKRHDATIGPRGRVWRAPLDRTEADRPVITRSRSLFKSAPAAPTATDLNSSSAISKAFQPD